MCYITKEDWKRFSRGEISLKVEWSCTGKCMEMYREKWKEKEKEQGIKLGDDDIPNTMGEFVVKYNKGKLIVKMGLFTRKKFLIKNPLIWKDVENSLKCSKCGSKIRFGEIHYNQ